MFPWNLKIVQNLAYLSEKINGVKGKFKSCPLTQTKKSRSSKTTGPLALTKKKHQYVQAHSTRRIKCCSKFYWPTPRQKKIRCNFTGPLAKAQKIWNPKSTGPLAQIQKIWNLFKIYWHTRRGIRNLESCQKLFFFLGEWASRFWKSPESFNMCLAPVDFE